MMKCEFEEMIGKEVSVETFEVYQAMYGALPENVTKQQFVKMLDIKAIPESEDAIRRRAENQTLIDEIQKEIDAKKDDLKYWKEKLSLYIFIEDKDMVKVAKRNIERVKSQIRELKYVIAA